LFALLCINRQFLWGLTSRIAITFSTDAATAAASVVVDYAAANALNTAVVAVNVRVFSIAVSTIIESNVSAIL
jgi:hypothetical protein